MVTIYPPRPFSVTLYAAETRWLGFYDSLAQAERAALTGLGNLDGDEYAVCAITSRDIDGLERFHSGFDSVGVRFPDLLGLLRAVRQPVPVPA